MSPITFLLLLLMFPYWFPVVVGFFLLVGLLWMIGYPIACTVHLLYVRVRYGKWVHWQYPILSITNSWPSTTLPESENES